MTADIIEAYLGASSAVKVKRHHTLTKSESENFQTLRLVIYCIHRLQVLVSLSKSFVLIPKTVEVNSIITDCPRFPHRNERWHCWQVDA